MEWIHVPTNKGMQVLSADQIVRVEARSNYCRIYLDKGHPITVAKVLHWFEGKLPGRLFYRIHRTHIVNKQFVAEILPGKKLALINGEQFQVSRRKQNVVMQIRA